MANTVTPTTVKNNARATAFDVMVSAFTGAYCAEEVFRIGDSEIAVEVGTAPTAEPIYAVFSPVIKDYCDRITKTKTIKAFDLTAAVNAYNATLDKRAKEAEEAAERKAKKVAEDKARREANAKAKAEHAKAKADALTAFKNRKMVEDVNVKVKP
jgi:hypothetical protein